MRADLDRNVLVNGLSIGAGALSAGRLRLTATADNVANLDTPGYRAQAVELRDTPGGGVGTFGITTDPQQGPIMSTGQPLDVALDGPGYFQVRGSNGHVMLTRDGSFRTDANGKLVTSTGERVVPAMTLPAGTGPAAVAIGQDGTVSANGTTLGNLSVVNVAAPAGLIAAGNGRYLPSVASGPARPSSDARVQQGALEGSNADEVDSMVDLVDIRDTFAFNVKAIQVQDDILRATLDITSPADRSG
jgi:flagellar basal-body rod protein FlgG